MTEHEEINKEEEEIYNILIQKKEINDKTPNLIREEEKNLNLSVTKLVKSIKT